MNVHKTLGLKSLDRNMLMSRLRTITKLLFKDALGDIAGQGAL